MYPNPNGHYPAAPPFNPSYPQQPTYPSQPAYPIQPAYPTQPAYPVHASYYTPPQVQTCVPVTHHHHHQQHGYQGAFYIESKLNGKVLDVAGSGGCGTRVITYSRQSSPKPNQLWRMESAGNGWFFITSVMDPNLVLDVEHGSHENCARIIVWDKKMPPTENQLWKLDGHHIKSAVGHHRGMVLDIEGGDCNDEAQTILYEMKSHDARNQKWEFRYV